MSFFQIVVVGQTNVCWLTVDIAHKHGIPIVGDFPKGKVNIPEHLALACEGLQANNNSSFSKVSQINLESAEGLLVISKEKNLDKDDKALVKAAEADRTPALILDINDHLTASYSRFDWWMGEYKINKLFVKGAFDYEKSERTEKLVRKLLTKQ